MRRNPQDLVVEAPMCDHMDWIIFVLSQGFALRKDQCAEIFSSERGMTSSIEDIEARFAWRKCGWVCIDEQLLWQKHGVSTPN